jgi:hypothetical protein
VVESGVEHEGVRTRIAQWFGTDMPVEFIEPADIKLQGGRAKFRHVVAV